MYFQQLSKELVVSHRKEEEVAGKEEWPATPAHPKSAQGDKEVAFCQKLDCTNGTGPQELDW